MADVLFFIASFLLMLGLTCLGGVVIAAIAYWISKAP